VSRRWLSERKNDPYHRMAKEQGYRSRAAFKLIQLNERFGFFKGAKLILDIGAAPGGWLQVANEVVGPDGLVVGVDLEKINDIDLENVKTIVGDILKDKTVEKILGIIPNRMDVVLSDLAQNVSGSWDLDHYRQIELARKALKVSRKVLKREGFFVVKVFQGSEYDNFMKEMKESFKSVKVHKPKASRKGSAEIYLVAKNLKNL
jgi:23S rRNA (uridine2552-2'-O)-methyltransferase